MSDKIKIAHPSLGQYHVIRRNGKTTAFDIDKISIAMSKAFISVEGGTAAASTRIHKKVEKLSEQVLDTIIKRNPDGGTVHIENIQDQVELALMREGEQKVARAYVIYREERSRERELKKETSSNSDFYHKYPTVNMILTDGSKSPIDIKRLHLIITEACEGIEGVDHELIMENTSKNIFEGITEEDVNNCLVMGARTFIEKEPNYSYVAALLLLDKLRKESLTFVEGKTTSATHKEITEKYADFFKKSITKGIELKLLDPELINYDLERLGNAIIAERDRQFTYLGLQTLYDRYFIHSNDIRFELPQTFFMRVAMGMAINEKDREARTIEFYKLLSSFDFMSSTPTLFNSGTCRPQLSSCYLTTIPDDLDGIFSAIKDDAMLSKYAGGLGNDWTPVRALGAEIKGTNGKSQGVVPFLKVANDTAVAVNQGGKRKGAVCAYLETWHLDIEEFLELRKNTGDERRRTHDMNTANWIPDLFMKRVIEEENWTLFSPHITPDLHDLYGEDFESRYLEYEQMAKDGKLTNFKVVKAHELWRKMLSMLFETGHPWITFKDPCNLRSPQSHVGVVHSSNLCTEITLNTSEKEIAVCNLGSINLAQHIDENGLNIKKLEKSINTAIRMLDNVIDYNYYSVQKAKDSNLLHRPIGLGLMGFQDSLYKLRIPYASEDAVEFADYSMEVISYYAIKASNKLAKERGTYKSYDGSLWSKGILPIDSIESLAKIRGDFLQIDLSQSLDWNSLRESIKTFGIRNSNCIAIAPTATISNICGVSQSIEPSYQNLFVKSNLSGEFTVVNSYLAHDLKKINLWDDVMINDLKYFDGSVKSIDRIPDELKELYATAFELDPRWLIEAASRRQKWIDQSQSLNLYLAETSGKKIDNLYKLAWVRGLKTTYYLRSLGATHMEKNSTKEPELQKDSIEAPNICSIDDPYCDACQ